MKTCTQMHLAALFTIAKNWEQPAFLSTSEEIDEMHYIHKMEYCSAIKSNKVQIYAIIWMNHKILC